MIKKYGGHYSSHRFCNPSFLDSRGANLPTYESAMAEGDGSLNRFGGFLFGIVGNLGHSLVRAVLMDMVVNVYMQLISCSRCYHSNQSDSILHLSAPVR